MKDEVRARPLPGRGETLLAIKRNLSMSADAVEDTAVELSTANERQRMERAHEHGLIAVVPRGAVERRAKASGENARRARSRR